MPRSGSLLLLLALALVPAAASAQPAGDAPGVSSFDALVIDGIWQGPRVPYPPLGERPTSATRTRRSLLLPVAVHADAGIADEDAERALRALEDAYVWLESEGWPLPPSDGGRSDTAGFDLFVRAAPPVVDPASWVPTEREPPPRSSRASLDVPDLLSDFDAALTYAEVFDVRGARLEACVTSAAIEAALLAADPAEAPSVRRATATFLTWTWTGAFGCDEDLVALQQEEPTRPWLAHDPSTGEGGALLLSALSTRHDDGSGRWIRDVWNATRQRTTEGEPHALPDVPWMLVQATELTRTPLLRTVVELGASRWFSGTRRAGARLPVLAALPDEATPPAWMETRWERLPRRLLFSDHGVVEPYGTAFATVDVRAAPANARVQIWLEGEYGVEWSLVAMRVDAAGREISRTRAPARERDPHSYLAVELLEGTVEVVLAVTNLSGRALDADEPDEHARSFRLTVDQHTD